MTTHHTSHAQIHESDRLRFQEEEYYLPYHWLTTKGAKEVQMSKLQLVASHVRELALAPGEALDLGCSDGKHTWELQRFLPEYTFRGVDFSKRAITFAQLLAPTITFQVQDGKHTDFADGTFRLVVSIEVIEHIPLDEVSNYLQEIYRVLLPGGGVVLTTPTTNRKVDDKHFQHFTEHGLSTLLQKAGFTVKKVSGFGKTLPDWADNLYRYVVGLPMMWRLRKHVQGSVLPVKKANCIVISGIKPVAL